MLKAQVELRTADMKHACDFPLPPFQRLSALCLNAALNMAVFLLIGKTSALTMNVAGVIKDWLLILLSVVMFG
jgi:hypothetical protein